MFSLSLGAQNFGYINTVELFGQIPEVKEATANVETYKSQLQKKGQDMVVALQTEFQSLQQKEAQGEMSPKQLEVEAQKLEAKKLEIAKFEQDSQQKIYEKNESLFKPIRDKVQAVIDEVAAAEGFDYIFDYSTGVVIYADASTDITSKVKSKLGM